MVKERAVALISVELFKGDIVWVSLFLFANVHDTFHSVSGCPFSTEVVLTQCGRPVRDLITLSLKEARAQKLKRTQRSA